MGIASRRRLVTIVVDNGRAIDQRVINSRIERHKHVETQIIARHVVEPPTNGGRAISINDRWERLHLSDIERATSTAAPDRAVSLERLAVGNRRRVDEVLVELASRHESERFPSHYLVDRRVAVSEDSNRRHGWR